MSSLKTLLSVFLLLQLLVACDFTPRLHKDIIRAQQYIHNQRYEDAIKTYHQILDENPRIDIKVKIYFQLGELLSTYLGKNKESLQYFEKIVSESNDPLWIIKSLEKMGEINFSYLRNYSESHKIYQKLNSFVPKLQNADFYEFRMATSLSMIGKVDDSINVYENILLKPSHEYYTRSIYEMGNAYFQKKEWQIAVNYWLDYIKKETRRDNLVQAKFLIANAYETMEELQKAYNLYYSILGEYPNTEVIRSRLQSIYERRIARKR